PYQLQGDREFAGPELDPADELRQDVLLVIRGAVVQQVRDSLDLSGDPPHLLWARVAKLDQIDDLNSVAQKLNESGKHRLFKCARWQPPAVLAFPVRLDQPVGNIIA